MRWGWQNRSIRNGGGNVLQKIKELSILKFRLSMLQMFIWYLRLLASTFCTGKKANNHQSKVIKWGVKRLEKNCKTPSEIPKNPCKTNVADFWNYFIQFPNKNAKEISLILVFLHSRLASIFDLISSIVDDILLTFSSLMLSFSPFSSSKTIFVLHGESSDPSCSETLMYFGFIPAVRGSGFLKSGLAKSVKLPKFNFPSFSFSEALFFNFFTFLCSKLSISSKILNIV